MDVRNKNLIAGDAFQTRGGIAVPGDMRWRFPFPTWATWNKEVAIDSAERLLNYKPSLLAVGHGSLIIDPEKKMVEAIQSAKNV